MERSIVQRRWMQYFVAGFTLALVAGLLGGVVLSIGGSWEYLSSWRDVPKGVLLLVLSDLSGNVNKSLFLAFFFVPIYLTAFLILHRRTKNAKHSCFLASAGACLLLLLLWAYGAGKGALPRLPFEFSATLENLAVGVSFTVAWFLITTGLFSWSSAKILATSTSGVKTMFLCVALVCFVNFSLFLFPRSQASDPPNIIVLLVDALRADHLSCYGYNRPTSPNIDRFAKESVIFTQAISHSTFTKTSIASLFTSLYPHQHGVYSGGNLIAKEEIVTADTLGEEETTLAEVLRRHGLLTMAWIEQRQLFGGFAQGFTKYLGQQGKIGNINREFLEWAAAVGVRHNFFAYLHYIDLHAPYRPKPPYDTMYGKFSEVWSPLGNDGHESWASMLRDVLDKEGAEQQKDVEQIIAYYDGQITHIDNEIGKFFSALKETGVYDNSLIVLTSDHGDGFLEHGSFGHTKTPYEELIRVPLIIHFPKARYGGQIVENAARLVDIMPTILDLLDVTVEKDLAGTSLLGAVEGGPESPADDTARYTYSEIEVDHAHPTIAVRTERFKYIHFQNGEPDEFYDLQADPRERNNIIDLVPDEAGRLREKALVAAAKRKQKITQVTLDRKAIEELKALGYVGN